MKYKVGDRVRIREWKAMKREYGVNGNGDIHPNCSNSLFVFSNGLKRKYCGRVGTIVKASEGFYKLNIDEETFNWQDWMFEGYAFEYGEMVEVCDDGGYFNKEWQKKIYVGYIDGANRPYITVNEFDNKHFNNGEKYDINHWKYARPIEKHIIIIDGKEIEISEESYNNLRKALGGKVVN